MARYKKRADGRYATNVRTGRIKDDGKPEIITLYAKTSKELEELVQNKKYELKHGMYCFGADTAFKTYAEEWTKVKKASLSICTKASYRTVLNNYFELIGDMPLGKITQLDIQRQINAHSDIPRSCKTIIHFINQVFRSAVQDGLVLRNPCYEIVLPDYVPKAKRALTDEEKEALKKADLTDEERAYLMLLYGCGLRPAEAYALTWNDINLTTGILSIDKALTFDKQLAIAKPPKTKSGIRDIPMPPITISALKAYKASSPRNINKILFSGTNGYKSASQYADMFDHIRKKMFATMGHKTDICAYVLRHNYASELYYSDISIKEAARLMGHSDMHMIMQIYAHLDAKRENTAEKIKKIAF